MKNIGKAGARICGPCANSNHRALYLIFLLPSYFKRKGFFILIKSILLSGNLSSLPSQQNLNRS